MKVYIALFVCVLSASSAAQQPAPVKPPSAPRAPAVPAVPAVPQVPASPATPKAPAAPPPQAPSVPRAESPEAGQPINIRVDISVSEQSGGVSVKPKTLMVILADRATGQTRGAFEDRGIYVDARPTIIDGRVRLNLTIQSRPTDATAKDATLHWQNSFALILDNGTPTLAFETSDPVTNRKLSIEVKATILK